MLYTSGQILREYLVVATRPVDQNGLGMAQLDAVANVRALRTRPNLLAEDIKVSDRLLELLETVECAGKQVHDANVVATMLVHGIDTVVTMNVDDFARFGDHVHVAGLHPSDSHEGTGGFGRQGNRGSERSPDLPRQCHTRSVDLGSHG